MLYWVNFLSIALEGKLPADEVVDAVRSVWWPTLCRLRTLVDTEDGPERASELLCEVTDLWEQLGRVCELDEYDPAFQDPTPALLISTDSAMSWWELQGCNWRECLCASAPCHRLKLCKGCWRAVYCGPRCQAL